MSRTKKVAPDAALLAAVFAFWKIGYHSLGTRQLEEMTGITRFTLQRSYGGKRALFVMALDHYLELFEAHILPQMDTGTVDGLTAWFAQLPAPDAMKGMLCEGCFLINSITEFPSDDAEISARAAKYFEMIRGQIESVLDNFTEVDALKLSLSLRQSTDLLISTLVAMNISNKAPSAFAPEARIAAVALIESWRV